MRKRPGRPRSERLLAGIDHAVHYGVRISDRRAMRLFTPELLVHLEACRSNEARRLLLGVSQRFEPGEVPEAVKARRGLAAPQWLLDRERVIRARMCGVTADEVRRPAETVHAQPGRYWDAEPGVERLVALAVTAGRGRRVV